MLNKQNNIIGHGFARNVLWNLLGTGLPLLVALFSVPVLINDLGTERFGVLLLIWMVVGYFSLFDLGLGRAMTKLVAEKLGCSQKEDISEIIWTALIMMVVLGGVGTAFLVFYSPLLVGNVLNISPGLQAETLNSFYILAVSIPIVISSTGLRGVLEAYQRFNLVNFVRIPLGVATFLGPVFALMFSNSLELIVVVLVLARILSWFAYATLCLKVDPSLRDVHCVHWRLVRPLLSFGGWMTVSNIVSPVMVYMDRFIIGSMITMSAVTYYATPYDVVTKLFMIPVAFMGVMFPAFSTALASDKVYADRLYRRSTNYIFLLIFPVVLIFVSFSYEGLLLWLGTDFADESSLVLQILAVGVLANSLANVPFGLVQGAGRPDLTAKLHMLELPFYLLLLWWLLGSYGITGAAIAWLVRVCIDALILFGMANKLLDSTEVIKFSSVLMFVMALFMLIIGGFVSTLTIKVWSLMGMLTIFFTFVWFIVLSYDEKDVIRRVWGG